MNNNHQKIKRGLRISGIICLSLGTVLSVIGFIDFIITMVNLTGVPKLFFLLFIGLPLVASGGMMLMFSFRKEILQYTKNETMPVYKETCEEIAPVIKNAVADNTKITCVCGALNDSDSKFCKECGKELFKICPTCNTKNDKDSGFCKNCGAKL